MNAPDSGLPQGPPVATPSEDGTSDRVIKGHRYDGIREYDNPMPGWWVGLLWATVAFSLVYVVALHGFGAVRNYGEDLSAQTDVVEARRLAYAAANPAFASDPETLAKYATNADNAAAGAATYTTVCAACHGDKGQGLIGPNLADDYWLHGAAPHEVYETITKGVLDKGMPAWESALTDEERGQIVAYIHSIRGSNPPGAKPPQGDKVEG